MLKTITILKLVSEYHPSTDNISRVTRSHSHSLSCGLVLSQHLVDQLSLCCYHYQHNVITMRHSLSVGSTWHSAIRERASITSHLWGDFLSRQTANE